MVGERRKGISLRKLTSRLEAAAALIDLPPDRWARLLELILPEEYGNGAARNPLCGLPRTLTRLDELADRVARGESLFRPSDADAPDHLAILLERATRASNPNGARAPRRVKGEIQDAEYSTTRGEDRAALPECRTQEYRGGIVRNESRERKRAGADQREKVYSEREYTRDFHLRLRRARKDKGWSLGQLGKKVGVTRGHVCNLERGYRLPSGPMLHALADAFGVEPCTMLLSAWPD